MFAYDGGRERSRTSGLYSVNLVECAVDPRKFASLGVHWRGFASFSRNLPLSTEVYQNRPLSVHRLHRTSGSLTPRMSVSGESDYSFAPIGQHLDLIDAPIWELFVELPLHEIGGYAPSVEVIDAARTPLENASSANCGSIVNSARFSRLIAGSIRRRGNSLAYVTAYHATLLGTGVEPAAASTPAATGSLKQATRWRSVFGILAIRRPLRYGTG